jgi:hypothetical protein
MDPIVLTSGSASYSGPTGHTDDPSCQCGKCEPAMLDGPPTAGQLLSGNPGCEWPACAIGESCRWSDKPCFDTRRYADD